MIETLVVWAICIGFAIASITLMFVRPWIRHAKRLIDEWEGKPVGIVEVEALRKTKKTRGQEHANVIADEEDRIDRMCSYIEHDPIMQRQSDTIHDLTWILLPCSWERCTICRPDPKRLTFAGPDGQAFYIDPSTFHGLYEWSPKQLAWTGAVITSGETKQYVDRMWVLARERGIVTQQWIDQRPVVKRGVELTDRLDELMDSTYKAAKRLDELKALVDELEYEKNKLRDAHQRKAIMEQVMNSGG